ncbi:LanC-like protein 3 homolog [Seminavis robusta]|uniref:LanC-like protein 3 homolog n=1 Tax=Seminavis robusta TaxID=568900 RepID=A0A9N8HV40_9STRA|nr:LanC-like protein 3 homolog [Seminavis robusta]|eukprot:Sro1460_g274630.1 LanC-like protein 3 homolog (473) ;mRNA; r:14011-15429
MSATSPSQQALFSALPNIIDTPTNKTDCPRCRLLPVPEGQRYLPNPYEQDYISLTFSAQEANELAEPILAELDDCYQNRFLTSSDNQQMTNKSVYTGLGGIAYAYLRLARQCSGRDSTRSDYLHYLRRARDLAVTSLEDDKFQSRHWGISVSFYIGAPGCFAIACVAASLLGEKTLACMLWKQLLQFEDCAIHNGEVDELLFGKAGYIYSLLFVQSWLEKEESKCFNPIHPRGLNGVLQRVARALIDSGRKQSRRHGHERDGWPLMYSFQESLHLGAAHGLVGVLKMLYLCWGLLDVESRQLVRKTLARLLQSRFPSGNLPHIVGSTTDKLVHWCHGSPGLPALLKVAIAADVEHNDMLRLAALQAGEHIWRYGVLLKGNGLCHGIAGNGYAFLSLYQLTGDRVHLQKAKAFAKLLANQQVQSAVSQQPDKQRKVVGTPNSPQSLMEGSAGVLCFLLDLTKPEAAAFPGWEL